MEAVSPEFICAVEANVPDADPTVWPTVTLPLAQKVATQMTMLKLPSIPHSISPPPTNPGEQLTLTIAPVVPVTLFASS
jgi:hypothetical protein